MSFPRPYALITGGTAGIGFGIARALADSFDLALAYESNEPRAVSAKEELFTTRPGTKVHTYGGRLDGYESARTLFRQAQEDFGSHPSVLVHAAGRIDDALFVSSEFSSHEQIILHHLTAGIALAHLCVPEMYRAGKGRLIFISSLSAHVCRRGQTSYAAAKSGIEGFCRTLALEIAHRGITANCISPGLINTDMTAGIVARLNDNPRSVREKVPAGFIGTPSDAGALARFLCSEDARYITGAVIPLDGGQSLGDTRS